MSSIASHIAEGRDMDPRLSDRFRQLMEETGHTQTTWAEALGVSQPAVANFLSADSNPRLQTIIDYAAALGASVEVVLRMGA